MIAVLQKLKHAVYFIKRTKINDKTKIRNKEFYEKKKTEKKTINLKIKYASPIVTLTAHKDSF